LDTDTTYITHKDSIVMMRYKWEWLAEQLQNAGINMFRISNHFNGGTATSRDGFFVPQNAHFKDVSEQFSTALAAAVQRRVRQVRPDYVNIMNGKINDCDKQPFWMIDDKDDDNPDHVRDGLVRYVNGATNGIITRIRSEKLGLSDGRDPFPSC
jgi:hypothetical protein